jgi:ribosomal peptide maturation radical SAM protein 1
MKESEFKVALVSMPFVSTERPSIQLGLLQAIGRQTSAIIDTFSLNLDFSLLVGRTNYEILCRFRGRQIGEWLFSLKAFPDIEIDASHQFIQQFAEELEGLLLAMVPPKDFGWLIRLRETLVPAFLTTIENAIPWDSYNLIGFTSSFQQNVASLALAYRLKKRWPDLNIVFGGANFDGDMGRAHMRAHSVIDYAVLGEGDLAFPSLLSAMMQGQFSPMIPNVAVRTQNVVVEGPKEELFTDLDSLPTPIYDDYFERALSLGVYSSEELAHISIPFESARGCWWGEKSHCIFCGLNANAIRFRSKSSSRVLDELRILSRRYRKFHFEAVDNIMDKSYVDALFGKIEQLNYQWEFFFEVKSNMSREQIRRLAAGGVTRIQPGIESLDSDILRRMRKGVTKIQNVNLLRWCRYYGISVSWNLLWGIPFETEEQYLAQSSLIDNLFHLQPPDGSGRLWMERYSPLFIESDTFLTNQKIPDKSYQYIYPEDVDLNSIAYFFDYFLESQLDDSAYDNIRQSIAQWKESWSEERRPDMNFCWAPGFIRIDDFRVPDLPGRFEFDGILADLYAFISDKPLSVKSIMLKSSINFSVDEVKKVLHGFVDRNLAIEENGHYLALAIPKRV